MARSSVEDFIVDFNKEEEAGGGGGVRVPPSTYRVKIVSAKTGLSENQGTPYLELKMRFLDGKLAKSKKTIEERLYNSPKAMSRFRLLLEALDIKPPAKLNLVKLVPKIKGGELFVDIEDDEREGYKTRSRVAFQGFINPDDYDPDATDEDEDLEEEEDEDLEDEDEDEDEDDEEEEEEEEEPPARKRRSRAKPKKAPARKRRKPVDDDEDEDDDDDDDDDEEEEEPPARKRRSRAKKAPAKKSRKKKAADEDDEEDEDLDDLDLDDM